MASRLVRVNPVTVNDVLDGQVKLDLECLDRIYLSGYLGNSRSVSRSFSSCGTEVSRFRSVIAATGEQLADTDTVIRTLLIAAYLLHVDETSINVNGTKMWLHVASTATLTSYFLQCQKLGHP